MKCVKSWGHVGTWCIRGFTYCSCASVGWQLRQEKSPCHVCFTTDVQVPYVGQEGLGRREVLSQAWSDMLGVGTEGGGLGRCQQVCDALE